LADGGAQGWSVDAALWWKQRQFAAVAAAAAPGRASASLTLDQFDVPGEGWGGRIELRPPAFGAFTARVGAEARISSGETNELFRNLGAGFTRRRLAGGDAQILGGFGEIAWELSDTALLSLGGRLDHWYLSSGVRQEFDRTTGLTLLDRQFVPRAQTLGTARAGGTWRLTPAIALRGAAYLGWRPPTLNELYRPFRVGNDVTEANNALAPERLSGIDVGFDYAPLESSTLHITLFANWLRGAVANVTVANGPGTFPDAGFIPAGGSFRQRRNLAQVRSTGAEVRAVTKLPLGLRAELGYTFARAIVSDAGAIIALQNKRLAQSPLHQARAQLSWNDTAERLSINAQLKHTGAAFEDDVNSRALGAVTTIDLTARWRIFDSTHLQIGLENATNVEIQSAISADGIISRANPRSLSASIATKF
jgi:vitamin B12 transporter